MLRQDAASLWAAIVTTTDGDAHHGAAFEEFMERVESLPHGAPVEQVVDLISDCLHAARHKLNAEERRHRSTVTYSDQRRCNDTAIDAQEVTSAGEDGAAAATVSKSTAIRLHAWQLAEKLPNKRRRNTRLRYLRWLDLDNGRGIESQDSIAMREGVAPATFRSGVLRAKLFLVEAAQILRIAVSHWEQDSARELARVQECLDNVGRLHEARDLLQQLAPSFSTNPRWMNLNGILARKTARYGEAINWHQRARLATDNPREVAMFLTNEGSVHAALADEALRHDDDHEWARQRDLAREFYQRALRLDPLFFVSALNLLEIACDLLSKGLRDDNTEDRQDAMSDAKYAVAKLGNIRRHRDRLGPLDWDRLHSRLDENKAFHPIRSTVLWKRGPQRWIRSWKKDA